MQAKLKIQVTVNKMDIDGLRFDKCYTQENTIDYEQGNSMLDISFIPSTIYIQVQIQQDSVIAIAIDREYLSSFDGNIFYADFVIDGKCYKLSFLFEDSHNMNDCRLDIWENMIDKAEDMKSDRTFSLKNGTLFLKNDAHYC